MGGHKHKPSEPCPSVMRCVDFSKEMEILYNLLGRIRRIECPSKKLRNELLEYARDFDKKRLVSKTQWVCGKPTKQFRFTLHLLEVDFMELREMFVRSVEKENYPYAFNLWVTMSRRYGSRKDTMRMFDCWSHYVDWACKDVGFT